MDIWYSWNLCSVELIVCPCCSCRMTMFSLINRLSITLSKLLTRYAVRYLLECWLYSFWCAFRWACFIFHLNPWLQLHPGALYLLGAVYLTGDCVKRDIASAMWCFHRASEKVSDFSLRISSMKYELDAQVSVSFIYTLLISGFVFWLLSFDHLQGHAGAAIAYGSLLLKGLWNNCSVWLRIR